MDSIQAVYTEDVNSPPGSVSQVRFCTDRLFRFAKERNVSVFLSGHITKTGSVAGPKALEHIVDVVLYLEGERTSGLRVLRAYKNRFGPADEVAFFKMEERGLAPIEDPAVFFASPGERPKVGVAYGSTVKGSLRIVVEIQSLVNFTYYPVPVRHSVGYEHKRLAIVLAILEKILKLKLGKMDVYLKVEGGLSVEDPYADMAVMASVISSLKGIPLDNEAVFVGEISLSGDFKSPPDLDLRVAEAKRLGFKRVYAPVKEVSGSVLPVKDARGLLEVIEDHLVL